MIFDPVEILQPTTPTRGRRIARPAWSYNKHKPMFIYEWRSHENNVFTLAVAEDVTMARKIINANIRHPETLNYINSTPPNVVVLPTIWSAKIEFLRRFELPYKRQRK